MRSMRFSENGPRYWWRDIAVRVSGLSVRVAIAAAIVSGTLLLPETSRAQDPAAFVTGLEDVPVMPGLRDVPDAAVIFDKPSGRLVEAYAEGDVKGPEVIRFYRETLPQLGWSVVSGNRDNGVFFRESERLEIHLLDGGRQLTVRFVLSPR